MKSIIVNHFLKATLLVAAITITSISSCKKDDIVPDPSSSSNEPGAIQGAPGNPRFNLQFTNGNKVDLDLYVQTPNGTVISYSNPAAQNGKLDVDCLCGDCPN